MTERGYEIRWAEWDGYDGPQLDEVVTRGCWTVHTEDLGGSIMVCMYRTDSQRIYVSIGLQRLPRSRWWDEIKDAWYERRWPCLWEPRQVLVEEPGERGGGPDAYEEGE